MKSISKLLPVVLFGVFGLVGCATHLQLPTVSDLAYTGVSARVLEQYRNYSAEPWEVVETPSVPAGYWKSGFTNFSGQDNPEENIAGLSDPTVYEVEFYEDWRTIEPEEGLYNWKPIDDQIALWGAYGKKVAIRIVTASHNTMETPQWLHEQYHVRKITDGLWLDFDQPKKIYELSGGVISDQRDVAITGRRSLYGDAPGALMSIKEGKLERSKLYGIEFDYRSFGTGSYYLKASSESGGAEADRYYLFDTASAEEGVRFWSLQLGPFDDYVLQWGLADGAPIAVDNILVYKQEYGIGKTIGYPNYFDPIFKEKWAQFITALADRYRDNEVVETICVSGNGRYGELGIEGDKAGLHDQQWLALGYTQEKYMDHVQSNIELFKRVFPEKKLRMVAGGTVLPDWTDENYIYYRGIAMCAEYGVEFKINGMQEAFGVWGTNAFSYGAARYRDDEHTSISIETAGQIYRNNTGKITIPTGQAITIMNRIMIDGVDNMYLYSHDALSSTVRKYLPYASEQMGHEMFTQYYTRFGVYREPTSLLDHPVDFTDIWLGLYQNNYMHLPGIPAQNINRVVAEGQHAVESADSIVSLDLDDRKQYHGLFGSSVSVVYLDQGTDSFDVLVHDSSEDVELRRIGTLVKQDSGQWKLATFYDSSWHQSHRNIGFDSRSDVLIDDRKDGKEIISLVEVNAVPVQSWKYSTVAEFTSDGATLTTLKAGDRFTIPAIGRLPAVLIRIPVFSDQAYLENSVRLALYGILPDGKRRLLSDKELYFARSGLFLDMPLYEQIAGFKGFEVEVVHAEGPVYLSTGADRQLTCSVQTFETLTDTDQYAGVIEARRPFYGFEVRSGRLSEQDTVIVKRLLPSSAPEQRWEIIESAALVVPGQDHDLVLFEPQTEGFYKLISEGSSLEASARYLMRAVEPKGALIPEAVPAVTAYTASQLLQKAQTESAVSESREGLYTVTLTGEQPAVVLDQLSYKTGANQQIRFALKNPTGNSMLRLYWKTSDQEYVPAKSLLLPVVPNDPTLRWYTYPLGDGKGYSGTVTGLKLVLAEGGLIGGQMQFSHIAVLDPEVLYHAEFDGPKDRYIKYADWKPAQMSGGQMHLDGMLAAASSVITYPDYFADDSHEAVIRLTNLGDAGFMDFGWEKALWHKGDYVFTDGSVQVPIQPYSDQPQEIVIPLDRTVGYEGRIRRLRLQFDNIETSEGIFIDTVMIRRR